MEFIQHEIGQWSPLLVKTAVIFPSATYNIRTDWPNVRHLLPSRCSISVQRVPDENQLSLNARPEFTISSSSTSSSMNLLKPAHVTGCEYARTDADGKSIILRT